MRPTLSASITLLFSGTGAKNSDMSQTKLQNLFKDLDYFFEDDGTVFKQKVKEVRLEEIRRILSEIQRLDNNNDGSDNRLSNLFSEGYGIGKDAKSKGTAISLISKYAYFLTDFQFPIYDSVVKEMYPKLCNYLFLENMPAIKVTDIARYINAIDSLRNIIGTSATYDAFDRLLWYVGKIHGGNLSLLLNMQDYSAYGAGFDINKSDLAELPFLKNNSILKQIFTLAQKLLVY